MWRLFSFWGLMERFVGEKSRSVLLDCWTNGVVGALSTLLDYEYELRDGARLLQGLWSKGE